METKTQAVSTGSLSACEVKQLGTASISFVQIIAFCSFAQETATITTTRKLGFPSTIITIMAVPTITL